MRRRPWRYSVRLLSQLARSAEDIDQHLAGVKYTGRRRDKLRTLMRRYSIENLAYAEQPTVLSWCLAALLGLAMAASNTLVVLGVVEYQDNRIVRFAAMSAGFGVGCALWFTPLWSGYERLSSGAGVRFMVTGVVAAVAANLDRIVPHNVTTTVVAYAAAGTYLAVVDGIVAHQALVTLRRYLVWPRVARASRLTLQAADRVAVLLAGLLAELDEIGTPWRTPRLRRRASAAIARTAGQLEKLVPYEVWAAGAGATERHIVKRRCRHVASSVRELAQVAAEAHDGTACRKVRKDLTTLLDRALRADWPQLMRAEDPPRPGWWRPVFRRILPAVLLVAAGLALSLLPASPGGVTGAQLTLYAAAVLSLLRADSTTQQTIVSTLRDSGK
jgi:hypothetical protein